MQQQHPHVIVWLGTTGDSHTPLTYTQQGDLLLGFGAQQSTSHGSGTTIGALRKQWGDPSVASYLPDTCPCAEHIVGHNHIIVVSVAALRDQLLVDAGPLTTEHGFAKEPWPGPQPTYTPPVN